jgi:glyoxylase-like metal-dependent hydrolase (beta-lactamase superfamily II)
MITAFAVADLTVHRVLESEGPFLPALDVFPDLDPKILAENRGWLMPKALDAKDMLLMCVQSYVVRTPHHTIMIDTCVGNDKERPARPAWHRRVDATYMRNLAAAGFAVDDIDYVMCTHLHVDHVGWNTRLENGRWVPTFPKARYLFAKDDFDHFSAENAKAPVPPFVDSVLPIVEEKRAEIVAGDHQIGDHVRLLPTPGHTPGHVAVRLGRNGDHAVMAGDLIHWPLQALYPELSPRFDVDKKKSAQTRRSFLERYCDTKTLCCTAHFPSPSAGRITRSGNGFRCEDATG